MLNVSKERMQGKLGKLGKLALCRQPLEDFTLM